MNCPRCRTLCTAAELRPAIYDRTQEMMVVDTKSGEEVFLPLIQAQKLGLNGHLVWVRQEVVDKRVCQACIEELRRSSKAHRSYKRKGWRA